MGRSLQRNDTIAPGNYPGCVAGILRILDYHHWHVKRLLPHKKHGGRRRGSGNQSTKVNLANRDLGEAFIDADSDPLHVKHRDTNSVPAGSRSGKIQSKFPSEENHRSWILSFSLHSWLQRTNPVHHLEPSENCWGDIETNEKSPVIPQKSNAKKELNKLGTLKANQVSKDVSDQQLGECVDILEIFKGNKEFFMKILQDPDGFGNHFRGLKNSNLKVRLAKSKSFPVARSPQARSVRPSTLEHKQNEVCLFLNGGKSGLGTRASKSEQHCTDSIKANDNEDGTEDVAKQAKVSSLDFSNGFSSNHGWNQVVISRFRAIKHKIKHALRESKREKIRHTPTEEERAHREVCEDRSSVEATEMLERLEITIEQHRDDTEGSNEDSFVKPRVHRRVRRTSSLSESLDRYTQLFDNTFAREAKYGHSRSLRLSTSEEEKLSSRARKAYKRNLSLPDIDSLSSFLIIPKHRSSCSRLSVDIETSESLMNVEYSDGISPDGENEKEAPCKEDVFDDTNEPARPSSGFQEDETCAASYPGDGESEIETCFSDCLSSSAVFPLPAGLELGSKCPQQDHWTENKDYLFVRHILELSTFIGDNEAPTWHSLDRQLGPLLNYEVTEGSCEVDQQHYRLLFDLVNETLEDMNEKSYNYFLRPCSRPMPNKERLLEDVWARTSSYLGLRPELDRSLDDVVARDLAKRDGGDWTSPKWEREMVALELEDLLFDQLLDEVLCSLD